MDEKDKQIVRALQSEGRLTNQELAERIDLSPSPCLRRVRALENSGAIKGYTAIVDEAAFDLSVTAFVSIRLADHGAGSMETFEKAIHKIDNIVDCYLMTGQNDFLLRILCDSLSGYEEIMRTQLYNLPNIATIESNFAYSTIKRSSSLPL